MKRRFIVKDILAPLRHLLKKLPEKNVVLILSLVVGVACGFAAVILKSAVEFIHHGLISWFDSESYNYLTSSIQVSECSSRCFLSDMW